MIIDLSISALTFFLVTYLHISTAFSLPVVDLGYELHQAFSLNETTRLYNFSNIRYAAPPLGNLRFRVPLLPKVNRTKVQTRAFLTSYFTNATFSASLDVSSYPVPLIQGPRISEDCLFLDVVVPQKVFDRAQGKTPVPKEILAPVIVYFYGGGYVLGDKGGLDPSGHIQRSQQQGKDGLGAFGWLAGHTVSRKGTPNAALHDQRLGLTWVAQNIHLFGGDTDRVTVMGVSAGSGSILHQLTAYKGLQGPSLFHEAILQSPAWEANYDTDKQERTFRQYLKLLNVSSSPYGTFTYGPVVDGVFVPDLPGKLLLRGEFDHSVKILNGHTLNEALMYTPPSSFQEWGLLALMDEHFLDLSKDMKETIVNVLYPPILDGKYGYRGWVERVSSALSDIWFQCNSYHLNHAYSNSTYTYVFSIPPAMHWMDHPYSFYIKSAKPLVENPLFQVTKETVAFILQDYVTSFVQTGKPTSSLAPPLEIYGPESRVVSIGSNNITRMRDPACNARCVYWQTAFAYSRDDL
ncbi:Carboxylesterase family protein [Aspergillus parasiticus SU-1]|uniref:Carboxylic ester hydrolase n=1 Tax=Aspergillus parasiticus (strain ATCC 56775 / NRRL 5862 / SRRC 143 / SU-1) TaxID=1403190 RepID=A0A0F0IH89_ASPPU|nr:Carboxylesterase family protein [Aspergillus parasiticus SU-1]